MLILALESSAGPASAAVVQDGKLLGECYIHTKQTHSQTLLPMAETLMNSLSFKCSDFDLMAVSNGPGSFTGVRIGVACVKGLAVPNNTPCCGVSTLETIAVGGQALEGSIICAVMDARREQVYNALFRVENGILSRLTEDRAVSIDALSRECTVYRDRLVLFGDGAGLCYSSFKAFGARLAPEGLRFQKASGVAFAAERLAGEGKAVSPEALLPTYLRLPQAERELNNKLKKDGIQA